MVTPMAFQFPDPNVPPASPSKMDRLAMGEDCCTHPLLGCIIGHGNGPVGDQARSYLISLLNGGQINAADYQAKLLELTVWEQTNSVQMPAPLSGYPTNIQG
jgi:hypothetical protein